MQVVSKLIFLVLIYLGSVPGFAYDAELAAGYAELFKPVTGAKAGKALHLIPPDIFIEKLKNDEHFIALDIRTQAEFDVFSMSLPDTLKIPVDVLFKSENLDRLPTDQPIIVVCKSGTRAAAAGTALRHLGFGNVYILKGGMKALSAYLDAKTANLPPEPKQD